MKALSIKEPWATLILEGKKTIETRTWKTNYRGEILLCASKNPKSNIVILLDNNFLALPSHITKLQKYIKKGWKMDFNQGLDIRLVNKENAELLAKVKHYKQIHFAWDFMKTEKQVRNGLKILFKAGIKPYRIMVYILCNYDTTFEDDLYRFKELTALGVDPFIMVYGKVNEKLKKFVRWGNRKWICGSCEWEDYFK